MSNEEITTEVDTSNSTELVEVNNEVAEVDKVTPTSTL